MDRQTQRQASQAPQPNEIDVAALARSIKAKETMQALTEAQREAATEESFRRDLADFAQRESLGAFDYLSQRKRTLAKWILGGLFTGLLVLPRVYGRSGGGPTSRPRGKRR